MINIDEIATNLECDGNGIWRARKRSDISYPDEGNRVFFQVEEDSFWFRHRNKCLLELVRMFPPRGVLFDVGGGNGFVSRALQSAGINTVLVEPGSSGVENAAARGVRLIIQSTLEDAGFKERSIPAMGLFDVLEHIQDDAAFLATIKRLLAIGGRLYLTTPAYPFLWSVADEDTGHYRRYTLRSLGERLAALRFRVDYASYIFGAMVLPIYFSRTLPSRLGIRKRRSIMDYHKDASRGAGWMEGMVNSIFNLELGWLRRDRRLGFGGTCMVAASALE